VLVHDEAVLEDPSLVESVASAARIAVSNARLQAEARARLVELAASRRRIVEAADAQRRRLERDLREGAERRLTRVEGLLARAHEAADQRAGEHLTEIEGELRGARAELRDFAQGIRPSALTEGGLGAALPELAGRAGIPVELEISVGTVPPAVEAAVYFVCAEALANAAKHAEASSVTVSVSQSSDRVSLTVVDDGVGGADLGKGSGLRGLADRVEALGGRLSVRSPVGGGTRLDATIPTDVQV
jgi:signal transduction histidine kinase